MRFIVVVAKPSPDEAQMSRATSMRFILEAQNFQTRILTELSSDHKNFCLLFFGAYNNESAESIRKEMEEIILENREEDICVMYIGHGQENGWALSGVKDVEAIKYEELRLIFAQHYGNLIFLNNCCYGGAGISALESHSGNSVLISPMPATHFGYAFSFISELIKSWKEGRFYDPENSGDNKDSKPVVIGDEKLQKLLFPQTAAVSLGGAHV